MRACWWHCQCSADHLHWADKVWSVATMPRTTRQSWMMSASNAKVGSSFGLSALGSILGSEKNSFVHGLLREG